MVSEYMACVEKACDIAIPKSKKITKVHLPWMSAELDQLKKQMITFKR